MNIKKICTALLCATLSIAPIMAFAEEIIRTDMTIFEYAEQEEVNSMEIALLATTTPEVKLEEETTPQATSTNETKTVAKPVAKKATMPSLSKNTNKMVYYMMKKNPSLSKASATKIYNSVMKHSSTYKVDPYLVFAVIEQESTFNPNTSYQGAYGLMQLYYTTFPYIGITMGEVYDIDKNIRAGVYELSGNFKMFGDTVTALSAYNAGSGNVKRGNYSTKYANSVIRRKNNIINYMN